MLTLSGDQIEDIEKLPSIVSDAISGSRESVDLGITLPPAAYVSQDFYKLEVERIFKDEWLCVGHVSQVENVGDYFAIDLFGEPMVVVRGKDKIRVLSRVCRHRWAPVAEGTGNTPAFSCPFHKWTYGLDGRLIGAPLMDRAEGFIKADCRLPEFRSEVVEELGLVFVTFSEDITPISERLQGLSDRVRQEGWELKDQKVVTSLDQVNPYNWKVQVETYVECYHHIGGHEKTLQRTMPAELSWCEEDQGTWTICNVRMASETARLTDDERAAMAALAPGVKPGEVLGHIIVMYPATLLTFLHGGCDIRILAPTGPGTTWSRLLTTRNRDHVAQPDFAEWLAEFEHGAELVNREDNDINDMQQLGVTSAYAEPGRFSHLEACAWHLAQFVRRKLAAY